MPIHDFIAILLLVWLLRISPLRDYNTKAFIISHDSYRRLYTNITRFCILLARKTPRAMRLYWSRQACMKLGILIVLPLYQKYCIKSAFILITLVPGNLWLSIGCTFFLVLQITPPCEDQTKTQRHLNTVKSIIPNLRRIQDILRYFLFLSFPFARSVYSNCYNAQALAGDNPTDHILQEGVRRNHDARIFPVLEYRTLDIDRPRRFQR